MTNDTSTNERDQKRPGRIPRSAWGDILSRHNAGETLSGIARSYQCTPSAISYILRKAQEEGADGAPAAEPAAAPAAPPPAPALSEDEGVRRTLKAPRAAAQRAEPTAPVAARRDEPQPERLRPEPPREQAAEIEAEDADESVEARLARASNDCSSAYAAWSDAKTPENLSALQSAVHELRKILARIEIDVAASRGGESARPPRHVFPMHRAAR